MSTTVRFTFEIVPNGAAEPNPLWRLRGIAKGMFERLGEWEDLIKQERKQLSDILDKTDR